MALGLGPGPTCNMNILQDVEAQVMYLEAPLCSCVHLPEESHQSGTGAAWHKMSIKVVAWPNAHLVAY